MTLEELRKVNFKYKKGGRLVRKAYGGFKSIYTPTSFFTTPLDNGTLLKVDIPTTTQTTSNTQTAQNTNTQTTSTTNTEPSNLMKLIFGESEALRINDNTQTTPTEPTKRLVPKKAGFLRRTSNERKDYEAERRLAINKRYGSDLDNKSRKFAELEYDKYYTNNTPYEMSVGRNESGSDYYNRVFGNTQLNVMNNFASLFNDYSVDPTTGLLKWTGKFNDTTPSYSGKYQDVYNWYQSGKAGDIDTFNTNAAKMALSMGLTWNNITNWSDMDDDRMLMIFDYLSNNNGLVSDGKLGTRTANRINGVRGYGEGKDGGKTGNTPIISKGGYRDTFSPETMKIILENLSKLGLKWDDNVYKNLTSMGYLLMGSGNIKEMDNNTYNSFGYWDSENKKYLQTPVGYNPVNSNIYTDYTDTYRLGDDHTLTKLMKMGDGYVYADPNKTGYFDSYGINSEKSGIMKGGDGNYYKILSDGTRIKLMSRFGKFGYIKDNMWIPVT